MPSRKAKPVRYESPQLLAFEHALAAVRDTVASLERDPNSLSDDEVRKRYFDLSANMQSNCESVGSGLLATIGAICVNKEHLSREFLPTAMQPIYHLGIEDLPEIRSFIVWVAHQKTTYLETQTDRGAMFLIQLSKNKELIVASFRQMYDAEDNEWRLTDSDVPDIPPILMG